VAPDEGVREAECLPDGAYFVLVEIREGLDDEPLFDEGVNLGDAVVVRLDLIRVFGPARLDRVGVDSACWE
jgi:hypothetical protein